jgi:hypothetical protein
MSADYKFQLAFGKMEFMVEDNEIAVDPCLNQVYNLREMVVDVGNAETSINRVVACAHHYLVKLVGLVDIKGTYK